MTVVFARRGTISVSTDRTRGLNRSVGSLPELHGVAGSSPASGTSFLPYNYISYISIFLSFFFFFFFDRYKRVGTIGISGLFLMDVSGLFRLAFRRRYATS